MTPEESAAWRKGWWVGMRAGVRWHEKLEKLQVAAGYALFMAGIVIVFVLIGLS
jgi:hypothetical protein